MPAIKNKITQFIFFIMALQVLNMSIDVPSAQMSATTSAGDYNYIDTYIEYITEVVLKFENAIPETKHRQHRELQAHKQVQVICQLIEITVSAGLPATSFIKAYPDYLNNYAYRFIKEINPPPTFL